MDTKILKIDLASDNLGNIKEASKILKESGTLAFPTETVYGLGANALDVDAVKKIFEAKGRPSDNPLIVHISDKLQIDAYAYINDVAQKLVDFFWPGPLTLIMNKKAIIPDVVTSGLKTVALRIPSHPIALLLLNDSKLPIAAPSANISGKPSPTTSKHVINDLYGKVNAIIESESSEFGLESTVINTTTNPPLILRPGTISIEEIAKCIPSIKFHKGLDLNISENNPPSPGMKYRHYAPKADLYIFNGTKTSTSAAILRKYDFYTSQNLKVGIICTDQTINHYKLVNAVSIGNSNILETIGSNLYSTLRYFDDNSFDIILSESVKNEGIGITIMNRLLKASGHKIINV